MPNAIKWDAEDASPTTVLSTELNSLADATASGPGANYDNGTNLHQYGWLEVVLGTVNPAAGNFIEIYMQVFTGGTSPNAVEIGPLLTMSFSTGSGTKRMVSRRFDLPPFEVDFELVNQLGATMAASGNTVKLYVANDEVQ